MMRLALLLSAAAAPCGASRPADNPCVTWVPGSCSVAGIDPSKFIPAIYSAWMWHPDGACGSANMSGSCSRCSGRPGDFQCGYIFPCFADGPDIWGHKDVCASEGPCIAHLPADESNVSSQTCGSYYPGKGPQWQHWGWQVAQKGNHPSQALGQLIQFVRKGITYVLARSPAATPFANCGPGDIGWVTLAADGTLGCMNAAANCVPWEMCNGYEVAYCKVWCVPAAPLAPRLLPRPHRCCLSRQQALPAGLQRLILSRPRLRQLHQAATPSPTQATAAATAAETRRHAVHSLRQRDRQRRNCRCDDHSG